MPNELLRLHTCFDKEKSIESIEQFNTLLSNTLNKPVFHYEDLLDNPIKFERFGSIMWRLLTNNSFLLVPFGEVFEVLWDFTPSQYLISLLLYKDLTAATFKQMYVLDYEPSSYGDHSSIKLIEQILIKSYRNGSLALKSIKQIHGGRAILNLQILNDSGVEIIKHVELGESIKNIINSAPEVDSSTYWSNIKESKKERILEFFLFDIFGDECKRPADQMAATCKVIEQQNEGGYFDLILNGIEKLIDQKTEKECLQYVHMDAGYYHVKKGREWFVNLRDSLLGLQDFSNLQLK